MMKYIKLFFISIILVLFSCEDYLDKSPDMGIVEDEVFDSYTAIRGYLDNCIKALPDYTLWDGGKQERVHAAAFSDEAAANYSYGKVKGVLHKGDWLDKEEAVEVGWTQTDVGTPKGRPIANAYYCIRITNRILEKVPDLPNLSDEEKRMLLGQAYFFRAYYHFEIIKRWGGMGYIDRVYHTTDDMDIPRISYQAATDRLIEDLNRAITMLPDEWPIFETGRPTILAAMAVKAMAELYAASPLMKNDINTLDNTGYDIERAKMAAKYADEVLKYIDGKMPSKKMFEGKYSDIFYYKGTNISPEALWYINSGGANRKTDIICQFQNIRFSGNTGNYGWAITTPSQNLVDMFEVKGLNDDNYYPYNDPRANFSWDAPYDNRDPRFYNNILYPGASYGVDKTGAKLYLEPWEGGQDYNKDNNYERMVCSGYMCIKFWWPTANAFSGKWQDFKYSCSLIRTTQIYLDYAEAMNEAYGPKEDPEGYGMTAVDAINKVRNRVGMPDVLEEFTVDAKTFRNRIRNERAVELMFENHRWWDIRRWMIAEDLFKDIYPIKGIRVKDTTPKEKDVSKKILKFEPMDIIQETRVFEHKHYWYPIAKDHVDMLDNTPQNPGW
jgi:hypothetical protein